jgi:AhpD family alkylhydroperoxidase
MKKQPFSEKIFTLRILLRDIGFLVIRIPKMIGGTRNKEISRAFIEKIMTVTSAVNDCTYCSWLHAKQAVASGISEEEVKNMLNLQFHTDASEFEATALLYAEHYAETNRSPEAVLTKKFFNYYGEKTANHLFAFMRLVYFGNLFGNTWDAVISRFKGHPAEKSSLIFELFFFLFTFFYMFPVMWLVNGAKK